MKCLTVKNPWATLILHGIKTLEIRTWATAHRGVLGIHVARRNDERAFAAPALAAIQGETLPSGLLVGEVALVDVRPMCPADTEEAGIPYQPDTFAWVLSAPIIYIRPIPLTGRLSLWEYQGPTNSQRVISRPEAPARLCVMSMVPPRP